ncbi:MAG: hypothetical protein NZT92_02275 [Abditibacteriales bacterium]|nr:hypothetical protein [Abditibacteriales bacterium]MDW8365132.1 hypothetical protein [Abditibacteriales bacterium]
MVSRLLTFCVIFIGLVALGWIAVARSAAIPPAVEVASLKSPPQRMTFAGGALYWLETDGTSRTPSRLVQLRIGGKARVLLEGVPFKSFAVAGRDIYFTQENSSSVWRIAADGGQPSDVIRSAQNPGEVFADEKSLYWTETAPAALTFAAHVPIANAISTIHQAARDGSSPRVLATTESSAPTFAGRLLGVYQGSFYWVEWLAEGQGATTTAVRMVDAEGRVSLLNLSAGQRECVRHEGALYCATWSDAGTPPGRYTAIKRLDLTTGAERTLTDWLEHSGGLTVNANGVFYHAQHQVWGVPEALAAPEIVAQVERGEMVCYVHDRWLFSYLSAVGSQATVLKQRAFKPRNAIARFFGLGM